MKYSSIRKYRYHAREHEKRHGLIQLFNFHRLLFGTLIFRGRKLAAFNMMIDIRHKVRQSKHPKFKGPVGFLFISFMWMRPLILLVSIRKRGVVSEVPFPITPRKQLSLTMRWLITSVKSGNKSLKTDSIAKMLISSIVGEGAVVNKKSEVHKLSFSNRDLIRKLLR